VRRHLTPGRLALAAILVGALAIRLYGLKHGLPFIYHSDESQHFTNYAVEMFDGGLNPHYFQNPATYTYLVHFALWIQGYDDILFVSEELVRRKPAVVERWVRAVARGWRYAIDHVDEATAITCALSETLKRDKQAAMLLASIPLIQSGERPLGWMTREGWPTDPKRFRTMARRRCGARRCSSTSPATRPAESAPRTSSRALARSRHGVTRRANG